MADGGSERTSEARRIRKSSLAIGIGLAVAVLALVAVVFYLIKTTNIVEPVALKVGDREVTKAQYDEYVRLAKARGVLEKDARREVIRYEKNIQIAKQYGIDIPSDYVQQVSSQTQVDQLLQLSRGQAAGPEIKNAYTTLQDYNVAFDSRLAQQTMDGYGVFVYEISAQRTSRDGDISEAMKQAHTVAARYRDKIVNKQTTASDVLKEVMEYNAQNGQSAKSGLYFLTKDLAGVDDASSGSVASQAFLLQQVTGKPKGLTDIAESKTGSVYFMDVLYVQKKREQVVNDATSASDKMRVVEYDV